MPYPRKLLNDHETVALDLHPHAWYFIRPITLLVISIGFGIAVMASGTGTRQQRLGWIAVICILGSLTWLVMRYVRWRNTNFVITSDRIMYRTGVVGRNGVEIPVERVNNVNFRQTMFERMLGVGDLMIESGGEDGQQTFVDIKNPTHVRNVIRLQIQNFRAHDHRGSRPDPTTQLERLEAMMERGSLTRDEFELQKRRILDSGR